MIANIHLVKDEIEKYVMESRLVDSYELNLERVKSDAQLIGDVDTEGTLAVLSSPPETWSEKALQCPAIIYIGHTPIKQLPLPEDADVIRVNDSLSQEELINVIATMFERLRKWRESIAMALVRKSDLAELLNCAITELSNPIALMDSRRFPVAWAGDLPISNPDVIWKTILANNSTFATPTDTIMEHDDSKSNKLFDFFRGAKPGMPKQSVEVPIYTNRYTVSKSAGALGATQVWKPLSNGQLTLLVEIANLFGSSPDLSRFLGKRGSNNINYLTEELLSGNVVLGTHINQALSAYNSGKHGPFIVFTINLARTYQDDVSLAHQKSLQKSYAAAIGNRLPSCIVVIHEEHLVIVETGFEFSRAAVEQRYETMKTALSSFEFKMGASEMFFDYQDLPLYYEQAKSSVELGRIINPGWHYFYFGDYAFEFLFQKVGIHKNPKQYCSSIVLKLFEYDRQNGTEFLPLMECMYRHNGNKAKAAEELFIHRNTLTYRLDKAQSITNVNSFDYDDRQFFLLSCRIMEWATNAETGLHRKRDVSDQ